MGVFSSMRHQPPFYPVQRESWPVRLFTGIERITKGWLFGCRMCGNCILAETAFVCPLSCPKGLRNGPCRGSTAQSCSLDPTSSCVWFRIYQQAEEKDCLDNLLEVNAPLDNRRIGCETLLSAYRFWHKRSKRPHLWDFITNRTRFNSDWEAFCYELRQPNWWQGDRQYHPPAYTEPVSGLEAVLRKGQFAVSVEVAPPMEPTGDRIARVAAWLKDYVDTANFTDNPLNVPRMSGLACAIHSLENDLEPVLQLQTRHRSRLEFEAEVVGATAVGVRNIVCMIDDIGRLGPGPRPRPELNDLDTVQALWMLRRLRDEGFDAYGDPVESRSQYFLGAIASPYAALPRYEAIITEKKINAGAQFLQTLPVFDLSRFTEWLEALDKRNLLNKVFLIPTVALLKSPRHARFMANDVPGVYIPLPIMTRMEDAVDAQEEGIQIALEFIRKLRDISEIHGVHLLVPNQEEIVPRLMKESGLGNSASRAGRNPSCFSKNGKNKSHHSYTMPSDDFGGTEYHRNLHL